MTSTQHVTNNWSITHQYQYATSTAERDFRSQANKSGLIVNTTHLISVTNTGDETIFEFTADALRPLHHYFKQWRAHVQRAKGADKPGKWWHQDQTEATERITDRSPWYARTSNNAQAPVHVSRITDYIPKSWNAQSS